MPTTVHPSGQISPVPTYTYIHTYIPPRPPSLNGNPINGVRFNGVVGLNNRGPQWLMRAAGRDLYGGVNRVIWPAFCHAGPIELGQSEAFDCTI